MPEEVKETKSTRSKAPSDLDLALAELEKVKSDNADLQEQMRSVQLQLQAVLGRSETSEEIVDFSRQVLERIQAKKRAGGKYAWKITNKRFTGSDGQPIGHVIWTNAKDAKEAVADWKRRAGVSWDPSEGNDPYSAEPVPMEK